MGVIYQLTFFLALGLLAVVITVFVFAVSLLGRAMEAAAASERDKLIERRDSNAKEMQAMKKEMEKAEASGQIPKGLARKLKKLEKRDKKFEKELGKIRRAPELLTVKGGVVPCSTSLLAALILAGVAWYLSSIQVFIWIIPVLIWITGLAAIAYSISRIYQCLKVVEGVAITSEQAALLRETEALKRIFRELEEEKKLKVELIFQEEQPPFRVKAGSVTTIKFTLRLVRGVEATSPRVLFFAPPGFDFPGHETFKQASDSSTPNYITTEISLTDAHKGLRSPGRVTLKAPAESNSFTIFYRITGTGFASDRLEFQLIVE